MVGKSVNKAMLPYLTGIDVRTAFLKLQEVTRINGTIIKEESADQMKEMAQQIIDLQNRITTMEEGNKLVLEALAVLKEGYLEFMKRLKERKQHH